MRSRGSYTCVLCRPPGPRALLSSVFSPLVPVILCIGLGFAIARVGWVRASAIPDLSNIVFLVLTPALLFRTMGEVRLQELDFTPVLLYFGAAALLFAATMALGGLSSATAARALAHVFSNTVMIGVPFVGLVYGPQGLVTLFTLISLHALILLTAATLVFELLQAREQRAQQGAQAHSMARTVWQAVRNSIVHPVPLPILAGLLFAQTGAALPGALDRALQILGGALGPMALLLVGVSLAYTRLGRHWRGALRIALAKGFIMPALLFVMARAFGLSGQGIAVMFTAAALPVGANVLLFTQRYGVMQEEVSSAIALSTALALFTLPVVLLAARHLAG